MKSLFFLGTLILLTATGFGQDELKNIRGKFFSAIKAYQGLPHQGFYVMGEGEGIIGLNFVSERALLNKDSIRRDAEITGVEIYHSMYKWMLKNTNIDLGTLTIGLFYFNKSYMGYGKQYLFNIYVERGVVTSVEYLDKGFYSTVPVDIQFYSRLDKFSLQANQYFTCDKADQKALCIVTSVADISKPWLSQESDRVHARLVKALKPIIQFNRIIIRYQSQHNISEFKDFSFPVTP